MGWIRCSGGGGTPTPDGNNIYYPISETPSGDKAYAETSIQDIADAIQIQSVGSPTYKVSEMAAAIMGLNAGLHATKLTFYTDTYTSSDLPVT